MTEQELLRTVRRRSVRRLGFSIAVLLLYFAYLLNYLPAGAFLGERLGDSRVTGSLAMFAGTIVIFLALEWLFLRLSGGDDPDRKGR